MEVDAGDAFALVWGVVTFALMVATLAAVVVLIARMTQVSRETRPPSGQEPPPGWWWDGAAWRPPGDGAGDEDERE